MAKQRNTKVAICVSLKIKDLAQQIYDLDSDDVLCLFKEVDALYMGSEDGFEWKQDLQEWINKRSEKSSNDPITTKDLRAIEDQYLAAFNLKRIGPCGRTEHESSVQDRG